MYISEKEIHKINPDCMFVCLDDDEIVCDKEIY